MLRQLAPPVSDLISLRIPECRRVVARLFATRSSAAKPRTARALRRVTRSPSSHPARSRCGNLCGRFSSWASRKTSKTWSATPGSSPGCQSASASRRRSPRRPSVIGRGTDSVVRRIVGDGAIGQPWGARRPTLRPVSSVDPSLRTWHWKTLNTLALGSSTVYYLTQHRRMKSEGT